MFLLETSDPSHDTNESSFCGLSKTERPFGRRILLEVIEGVHINSIHPFLHDGVL